MVLKIKNDIKEAMINKDELTKNTLRMVQSNAQMEAKEKKEELSDTHILNAINKELKQTRQALKMLEDNSQTSGTFYEETVHRIAILEKYLPKQLTEEEIEVEVRKLIEGIDKTNKGLIMKTVMSTLKGQADGKLINQVVMRVLAE